MVYVAIGILIAVICCLILLCCWYNRSSEKNTKNDESQLDERKSSVLQTAKTIYQHKNTQRLFLISSILIGIFDVVTDWSVTANFYITNEYGWGITLTAFLLWSVI